MLERVQKHRKAIGKGSTTKTERIYEKGSIAAAKLYIFETFAITY